MEVDDKFELLLELSNAGTAQPVRRLLDAVSYWKGFIRQSASGAQ